jgi:hypothetical protein
MNSTMVPNASDRCHRSWYRGSGPVALGSWIASGHLSCPEQSSSSHLVDLAPCHGRPYFDLIGLLEVLLLSFQNPASRVVAFHRVPATVVVHRNSVCKHHHLLEVLAGGHLYPHRSEAHLAKDDDPRLAGEEDELVDPLHHCPTSVVALPVVAGEAVCGQREVPVGHTHHVEVDPHQAVLGLAEHIFDRRFAKFVAVALNQSIHHLDLHQQYRLLEPEAALASGLAHSDDQARGNQQNAEYLLRAWAWGFPGNKDGLWHQ